MRRVHERRGDRWAAAALTLIVAIASVQDPHASTPPPTRDSPPLPAPADTDSTAVAELRRQAARLSDPVRTSWVQRFLDATSLLPHVATRTVFYDSSRTHFYWESEAAALPDSARARLIKRDLDETFYYNTRYGSPLAYSRPFELLAAAGVGDPTGLRFVDYGYGTVGHLRLLASLRADVVGIEVDPLLHKLYGIPGDQGDIPAAPGHPGHLRLVHGSFPGDPAVAAAVGEGFDVFISKNTLKNGYIHPARDVDPRRLVHLGVSESTFVAAIRRVLKPGGLAMIYNLCPAPAPPDKPYIPWADGRCPFPRALWEAQGFEVLAFDRNDDAAARAMGHTLGWDQGEDAMNLEHDLFGSYTLARKRGR